MLLPGMLPLLVYVAASELWGDVVGLWVGMGIGVAEFLFILVKNRRIDWFVLLDTLLLVSLGLVSLVQASDLLFRLKPAFMELIMAVLVGFSAFGPRNLLMGMALRGEAARELREKLDAVGEVQKRMKGMLISMTLVLLVHIGLTVIASLQPGDELWLFVTGPGLFILFGAWFLVMLIVTRMQVRRQRVQGQYNSSSVPGSPVGSTASPEKIARAWKKL